MKAASAPPMRVVPARGAGGRDARGDRPDPAAPAEWVLHRSAIHREAVEALRSGLHVELEILDTRGIMCGHSLCEVIGQALDPLTSLPLVCVLPPATNMSAVLRWAVLNLSAPNAVLLANRSLHSVPDFDASHFVPVEVRWRHRPVEGITEDWAQDAVYAEGAALQLGVPDSEEEADDLGSPTSAEGLAGREEPATPGRVARGPDGTADGAAP